MEERKNYNQLSSFIYVLFMGAGYPLIRFVSTIFDAVNVNAIMFLSGGALFVTFCALKFKKELIEFRQNLWLIPRLIILACCTAGNMYCFVAGMSKTSALAGSIFGILSMPFSIVMASLFFKDEREKAKNIKFIVGGILAIIGSFIYILNGSHYSEVSSDFLIGIGLLAGTIIIQALQSLMVKEASKHIHSVVISSFTSIFTGILYIVIGIFTGKITELFMASFEKIGIVSLSGIYAIFVGMIMTFYIIHRQGVVVLNILKLIILPATALIGYFFLGEKITLIQGVGAGAVLIGCMLALNIKKS